MGSDDGGEESVISVGFHTLGGLIIETGSEYVAMGSESSSVSTSCVPACEGLGSKVNQSVDERCWVVVECTRFMDILHAHVD